MTPEPQLLKAETLLEAMVNMAYAKFATIHERWADQSQRFGDALLAFDIQRCGRLDLVLRLLEQEFAASLDESGRRRDDGHRIFLADDFRILLSNNWLLSAYEICRLCAERGLGGEGMERLRDDLALVRMPLVKGAVKGTNKRGYAGDPHRPKGLYNPATGSVAWGVQDHAGTMFEIVRVDLSDAFLALTDAT